MRTYAQAIKDGDVKDPNKKVKVRMFQPVKPRQGPAVVMRPGKTAKDRKR